MATYSNDATTSIVLSSVKNIRADGNNSLFTVGANEEYELIKYFQIDQDGSASVSLYGIYDSDIIDFDVPSTGGEKGFYERINLAGTGVGIGPDANDYHVYDFNLGAGNAYSGSPANTPVSEEQVSDHTGFLWTTDPVVHRPVKFYQGAEIKVFYSASNFVSPEECQIFFWFKKTVHNG
tara:strand:- start:118 stop:654 length:537 start_codon:yes stop_codon:yes gene_type:complete